MWQLILMLAALIGATQFIIMSWHTTQISLAIATSALTATMFFVGYICGRNN
ncbi:MAG: hypothetical protein U1A25_00485 [Candidatus Sungbacteria bacterium]|nr:hypothetical protein [bacterium]MDZ4260121.1 hypothetical protein [Candidatus Sungbacteria bacterium]